MNIVLPDLQDTALSLMEEQAVHMGLKGAAAVLILTRNDTPAEPERRSRRWPILVATVGDYVRQADPVGRNDPEDVGTNYVGVVCGKIAEMVETLLDSGTSGVTPKKGTYGWKGGRCIVTARYFILTAFSGGSGEQDRAVAFVGVRHIQAMIRES